MAFGLLQLLFKVPQAGNGAFFAFPLGGHGLAFVLQVGQFLLKLLQAFPAGFVLFFSEGFAFDLKLHDGAVHLVQAGGLAVNLGAQVRGGLIDEVDGLIRQLAVRDVAGAKGGRGDHGAIGDAHAVVYLVALFEPAQDADGIRNGWFFHHHGLEAALQGGIFLHVFAVFVQGGRANQVEFAAGEHGFQDVAGIHTAFSRAGADDGVHFIDEEDDVPLGVGHFFERRFEALLELTAVLGPGYQGAHVQLDEALVLEAFGHVAFDDALGQAFNNGGFTHTRFADEGRVVLGAAAEDLDGPADLFVTADHRVQFALAGKCGKVAAVFLEGLISAFRVLAGNGLAAAQTAQSFEDGVFGEAVVGHALALRGIRQAEQDVLGGGIVVAHAFGIALGGIQGIAGWAAQAGLGGARAVNAGPVADIPQ